MFRVVERAFSAGVSVLYVNSLFDQVASVCEDFCCISSLARTRGDPKDLNIVFLCCSLEKSKIGLNHLGVDAMLLAEKLFVESQLVGRHLVGLAFNIPTPRTRLPINDVILAVWCFDDEVNKALEKSIEFKLRYWLIKVFFA